MTTRIMGIIFGWVEIGKSVIMGWLTVNAYAKNLTESVNKNF